MSVVKKLAKVGMFGLAGLLLSKKKKAPLAPTTQPTVAPLPAPGDVLSKRRGAGANAILGALGAESGVGKPKLGM